MSTSGQAARIGAAAMSTPRPYRVLILEQASLPVEEQLHDPSLLDRTVTCRREQWSDHATPLSPDDPIDLILPVLGCDPERAERFFGWLAERRLKVPTLAILSVDLPSHVMSRASEVVDDFVLWPFRAWELHQRVARMLRDGHADLEAARNRLSQELGLTSLVGADPAFLRTIHTLPRVAACEGIVLIAGETGTGKELFARAIHHLSKRRTFPFVALDCGGFPEQLFESELFGHTRGAFTDARSDHRGLTALAEGGTLFLDEIDALSLPSQAKLLRFLEDRFYKPLGAERFERANVRILAATNRHLEREVKEGRFREDLFFRLNVFRIRTTPLRERRSDIALLARHFVETLSDDLGCERKCLSPAALRILTLHDWPGNVRELRNEIQRAIVLSEGPQILPTHICRFAGPTEDAEERVRFRDARSHAISEFERAYLEDMLAKHRGNITRAAREAGKDRRAFGKLVKKHRMSLPPTS